MKASKKILFLHSKPPYGTFYPQEAFDVALMAAAFNLHVSLAFLEDGVFQLVNGQNSTAIDRKPLSAMYQSLAIYDIKDIFVETESLLKRGFVAADLALPVTLLTTKEFTQLMQQQDVLLNW